MNGPLISIIIPVYNVEAYLAECIESVISQTYGNIDVILIDDGSEDGGGAICDFYAGQDARIRVIHQAHQGLSAARNAGMDNAVGSIMVFLDSDDVMKIDAIECIKNELLDTGADIVAFGAESYRNPKKILSAPKRGWYDRQSTLRSYVTKGGIAGAVWTKAFRSRLLHNISFREGHNYSDVDFFFRALNSCNRLYAIPNQLIKYRNRTGSITLSRTPENFLDIFAQIEWVYDYAKRLDAGSIDDVIEKLANMRIRSKLVAFSSLYHDRSDRSEAIKLLCRQELMRIPESRDKLLNLALNIFQFSPELFVILYSGIRMIRDKIRY